MQCGDAQYGYSTNIIYKANDGTTNQDTQLVGHATDPVLKGKLQNSPFPGVRLDVWWLE